MRAGWATRIYLAVLASASLIIVAGLNPPAASEPKAKLDLEKEGKVTAMTIKQLKCGFRHDPIKWAENDASLQAAMVRVHVLERPKEGDEAAIRAAAAELRARLEKQFDLCDPPGRTHDLLHVACAHGLADADEIGRLILNEAERGEDGAVGIYETLALCHAGLAKDKTVRASVKKVAARVLKDNPWHTCPWGMFLKLRVLWYGREVADVQAALEKLMGVVAENANSLGCIRDKDPWGLIDVAGIVDHPAARGIVERAIPMILRAQRDDGGWGGNSFQVFRALARHDLIEPLRELPALPPDWKIVQTIPAPADKLFTMTWDGERLWALRPESGEAFAISPEDGRVLRTLKLSQKNVAGIGWWDGALAVTQQEPKRLLKIHPETGKVLQTLDLKEVHEMGGVAQVGNKLWVCDAWMPCVWVYDPAKGGKPQYKCLGGPGPLGLAVQDGSVWHFDWLIPLIIRTDPKAGLVDCGEEPLDHSVRGLASDGRRLWALDAKSKRICVIEKTESGKELTAQLTFARR
ncbi:MAG: YncE family protein [Planctomycetota bacterium]|jgi:hypothetical protein